MKVRRLVVSIAAAGALVTATALPVAAKGRPACPGGSSVTARGVMVCLK
jgi:hypothetical protein